MKRPTAGITPNWIANEPPTDRVYGQWMYALNQKYSDLAESTGFVPLLLLPGSSPDAAGQALRSVDLLVLTGGGDPDPVLCSSCVPESRCLVETRYGWDISLFREAVSLGIPVLGICLGIQLIAVSEGEELIVDILTEDESRLDHHGSGRNPKEHDVEMVPGTLLHALLGDVRSVSTYHHQAVRGVPAGYAVSARAADGILEGMESADGRILAVQWHPERDGTGPAIMAHFRRLCAGE
jgi:putative glutamine amidotransferase